MPRGFSPATYQGQGIQQADWSGPSAGQIIGQGLADFASSISQGVEESRAKSNKAKALRTTLSEYGLIDKGGGQDLSLSQLEGMTAAAPYLLQQQQSEAMSSAIAGMTDPSVGRVTPDSLANVMRQQGSQLSPQNIESLLNYFGASERTRVAEAESQRKANMGPEWSDVYTNERGERMQRNFRTGQVEVVSKPKQMSQAQTEKLESIITVSDRIGDLRQALSEEKLYGPIVGRIRNINPWKSANVSAINAMIDAAVPGLARGVFGEVGVLTDQDVARYKEMLPTLKNTAEQRDALMDLIENALIREGSGMLDRMKEGDYDIRGYVESFTPKPKTVTIGGTTGYEAQSQGDIDRGRKEGKPVYLNGRWLYPKKN